MKNKNKTARTVYFGGTFDLLNIGHIKSFEMCKTFGNYLIVGLNTDKLVRSYKQREPVLPYDHKKTILEAIRYVDKVIPVHSFSPMDILSKLKPDVYCVGSEWEETHFKEIKFVKSYGGEVRVIPAFPGVIHTSQIKKILLEEAMRNIKE